MTGRLKRFSGVFMRFFKGKITRRIVPACIIAAITFSILANPPCGDSGAVPPLYARVQQVDNLSNNGVRQDGGSYSHGVRFLNDRARDITGATVLNVPGFASPAGLTGKGQLVAMADSGLDAGRIDDIHPDLRSAPGQPPKVTFLESLSGRPVPDDPTGHGTHMAATVAGAGTASDGMFKGIAPDAGIYFQAILNADGEPSPPSDLSDLFRPAYQAGARVHVDGWGGGPNEYGSAAAQIDAFVRKQPDFLPVFGAGNDGPEPGTLTTEANSKNALVVGASVLPRPALAPGEESTLATASFSSRGPAADGRIKPEVLAPASSVISARSRLIDGNLPGYPQYTQMEGTSMAAAVAGGSAVLLGEYFKDKTGIAPSAALLRAALANGARMPEGGPSREGFGVIDLTSTVLSLKDGSFLWSDDRSGLARGDEATFTYTVTDITVPFKTTLAWTDPPAAPGGGSALVNDLDLLVESPDGTTYFGNNFLNGDAPDRANNIEQVCLPTPAAGRYTVRVRAASVQQGAVRDGGRQAQDYALVMGQPPKSDRLLSAGGGTLSLAGGGQVSLNPMDPAAPGNATVLNAVDGKLSPAAPESLFPGELVYITPKRTYLAARLWRGTGVSPLRTGEGMVFTEMNRLAGLGGYLLDPGGKIFINNKPAAAGDLPPGLEVTGLVNPVDQTLWRVDAQIKERGGLVSSVRRDNGRLAVKLLRDNTTYFVSPLTALSYVDSFTEPDALDMPFGTGALDDLDKILPGMSVNLHLSSSGIDVQYLSVKRWVAVGTIREVDPARREFTTATGSAYRLYPGAPVKIDGKYVDSLAGLSPGDHFAALLTSATGEVLGLVARKTVFYGKVIDYIKKSRTLYLLDDASQYQEFTIPPEAEVYRWNEQAGTDSLITGSRIRLTADAGGRPVSLDIAEKFYVLDKTLTRYTPGEGIVVSDGVGYRATSSTRYYKNGRPVPPEFLLSGEEVDLECVAAPSPAGPVLLSVNVRTGAPPPVLLVSSLVLPGRLVVSGRSGAQDLYLFSSDGSWQTVPANADGGFTFELSLKPGDNWELDLVAINRESGGVSCEPVTFTAGGSVPAVTTGHEVISRTLASLGEEDAAFIDPLPRAAAVAVLARLLDWPQSGGWPLSYSDERDIPAPARSAVGEAQARGIINGYPDGSFRPRSYLSRAEAAMILARIAGSLGFTGEGADPQAEAPVFGLSGSKITLLQAGQPGANRLPFYEGAANPSSLVTYADAAKIPSWAAAAVSETTAAGIFRGRPGRNFEPDEPVTAEEMADLIDRLLAACARAWSEQ